MKRLLIFLLVTVLSFYLNGCTEKQKSEEERIRITIEQKKEEPVEPKKEKEQKPEPRKQEQEKPKTKTTVQVQKETPPPKEVPKKQAVEEPRIPKPPLKTFPPQKQETPKKEELEKGPSPRKVKKQFSYVIETMRKRYLLTDDIPGVSQDIDSAKALISSEKYNDASILLDSVQKKVDKFTIDKEFIDNKITRLAALLKYKFPQSEAEKRLNEYKNKISEAYNEGNYNKVNKYLTKVILKIRGKKEEDVS